MPDIEMLNTVIIKCDTIGTQETDRAARCIQTQPTARVQDVSNTMQTQGKKKAGQEVAIQTPAAIQI